MGLLLATKVGEGGFFFLAAPKHNTGGPRNESEAAARTALQQGEKEKKKEKNLDCPAWRNPLQPASQPANQSSPVQSTDRNMWGTVRVSDRE